MNEYLVLGFYLRIDISPEKVQATLYDIDDVSESSPIASATAGTADVAVSELVSNVTFGFQDPH